MAGISSESALEWLSKDRDVPLVQHIHNMCVLHGKTIEDISEVSMRSFVYEGPFDGDWKTFIPAHLGSCALTFTDKTSCQHYWNFATKTPMTPTEFKVLIDADRLMPDDRALLEADLGPFQKQVGASDEEAKATSESSEESTCSTC